MLKTNFQQESAPQNRYFIKLEKARQEHEERVKNEKQRREKLRSICRKNYEKYRKLKESQAGLLHENSCEINEFAGDVLQRDHSDSSDDFQIPIKNCAIRKSTNLQELIPKIRDLNEQCNQLLPVRSNKNIKDEILIVPKARQVSTQRNIELEEKVFSRLKDNIASTGI